MIVLICIIVQQFRYHDIGRGATCITYISRCLLRFVRFQEKIKNAKSSEIAESIEPSTEHCTAPAEGSPENLTPEATAAVNELAECDMTASMLATKQKITTEEEAKAALAERRRLVREQAERDAELERQRLVIRELYKFV